MNFVSKRIKNLIPYTAGEQIEYRIKLNTNENPYPPTPKIYNVLKSIDINDLRLYPDQNNLKLKHAIAEKYNVNNNMVFVGNGSDEILALLHLAFFIDKNDKIAFPDITYSLYPVYSKLFNINSVIVPLKNDFTINLSDYTNLDIKGIIIANPNAPTSIAIEKGIIEQFIIRNQEKLIIIDEAYIDFCSESVVEFTNKYDNLLVIKTFSKSYSLAGIRCGYAIGNNQLIDGLKKVKDSFNNYPVDYITEKIATIAVGEKDYYKAINNKVIATRERVCKEMIKLGFDVLKSSSNFIFVTHNDISANNLYQRLKKEKILIRHWNKERISNHCRISIGTDKDMDELLRSIAKII